MKTGNVLNETVGRYPSILVGSGVFCAPLRSPGGRKQKIKVLRSSTSLITQRPLKILHKCLIRFGNL